MINIPVDPNTAEMIERQARERGISVSEYLRALVNAPATSARPSWDDLEAETLAVSSAGHPLPADFSRADIYRDHD